MFLRKRSQLTSFFLYAILPPDYFYIDTNRQCKVISKQSRQKKKVNTPEGMTEYEHSLLDGLSRVWDCGKIRFIYRKKD